jgi:uracil-DNA glycosylase family 4
MADDAQREIMELSQDLKALLQLQAESGAAVIREEPASPQAAPFASTGGDEPLSSFSNASGTVVFEEAARPRLIIVMSIATGPEPMKDDAYASPAGEMLEAMRSRVLLLARDEALVARIKYSSPRPQHRDVLACGEAIRKRIADVQPTAVLCFGLGSARTLLGDTPESRTAVGRWLEVSGKPMLTTLHPDDLLAHPADKRTALTHLQWMRVKLSDD